MESRTYAVNGIPVSIDFDIDEEPKKEGKFSDFVPSINDAMIRIKEVGGKNDENTKSIMDILEKLGIEMQKIALLQSKSPEIVVNVPKQDAPIVNVNPVVEIKPPDIYITIPEFPVQPAPIVNVESPQITVTSPEIKIPKSNIVVNVPQQEAPVVNVSVPEQNIVVNVPEQTAPVINLEPVINIPAPVVNIENKFSSENVPAEEFFVNRDVGGRIVSIEKK